MLNVSFGIQREIDIPEVITSRPAGVEMDNEGWAIRRATLFSLSVAVMNLISIYLYMYHWNN